MCSSQIAYNNIILKIYQDSRTVFKIADIALLTGQNNPGALAKKLNYYVKTGKISSPRRGFYVKPDYSSEELASKLYTPSYLSLQYTLQRAGIIFQYSENITLISYLSREVEVNGRIFTYRRAKRKVLYNWSGIAQNDQGIYQATPERAFIDLCYLEPEFYFDNPGSLNRDLVEKLLEIYSSPSLNKRVKKIFDS